MRLLCEISSLATHCTPGHSPLIHWIVPPATLCVISGEGGRDACSLLEQPHTIGASKCDIFVSVHMHLDMYNIIAETKLAGINQTTAACFTCHR